MSARLLPLLLVAFCTPALADPPEIPIPPVDAAAATTSHATKKPAPGKDAVDLQDIRSFTAVYSLVKQAYVENVDDHQLMQAAIRGLLAGLDPHSEYLDRKQIDDLTEDTTGSYNGLGIEVVQLEGTLKVVAPIDDSPAERAGIKAGDIVVAINGVALESAAQLRNAIALLRVGQTVELRVLHRGSVRSVSVSITGHEDTG